MHDCVEDRMIAAAELSEIPVSSMLRAAMDLEDGIAHTDEARTLLCLMMRVGGAALLQRQGRR